MDYVKKGVCVGGGGGVVSGEPDHNHQMVGPLLQDTGNKAGSRFNSDTLLSWGKGWGEYFTSFM